VGGCPADSVGRVYSPVDEKPTAFDWIEEGARPFTQTHNPNVGIGRRSRTP
jgi:hypothetical protein